MLNCPDAETRRRLGLHARYKAEVYKHLDSILFVEDEPGQAARINYLTKKPVLCVSNWKIYNEVLGNEK